MLESEVVNHGGPVFQAGAQPRLRVAGIGCSAGWLAAITELLQWLGLRPGIAVVLVPRLDRSADGTGLAELFSRLTPLPVLGARAGLLVKLNHVYVAPANASLGIVDGILQLAPPVEAGDLDLPIDRFFVSLAADRTVSALGAVLTGTGADGSQGIRAIKASGGITFCQDASADDGGMPEGARASGCVDFFLSPEGIARELVRIGAVPLTTAYQDKLQQMAFDTALTEERERRRIATEVHDHIGQALALVQIKLASIREAVAGPARVTFDEAVDLLEQSIVDTRTLIFDLSPPVLYDLGLREALSWLGEEFEKRHGVRIEITDDGVEKPLDDATAGLVFRAVRELLTNVVKHAKAASARVSLGRAGDHIDIDVEDQGAGFDADDLGLRSSGGFGLFSVREQIYRLGGKVEVTSAPGQGTRVRMRVPLKTDDNPQLPVAAATP